MNALLLHLEYHFQLRTDIKFLKCDALSLLKSGIFYKFGSWTRPTERKLRSNLSLSLRTACPYPLTLPTVRPLMKYFWKNGYTIMIGPITTITVAIVEEY